MATIEALGGGAKLMGQDKWLGGVGSPCGKYIYGVPGHAKDVLRIVVETGEVDTIGGPFEGKFKWLRGVDVPPEFTGPEHPAGLVFALPSNADSVLPTQEVSTLGAEMSELKGDWKWHGGNLGNDGMIYGIPCNANAVVKVNPRTSEVTTIGGPWPGQPARQRWYGGIKAANGSIYGIPHTATGVLKITPETQQVEIIGLGLPEGGWKWHGGIANAEGTVIYGFPNHSDTVLRIDTVTDTVTFVG
eukprot:gene16895-30830_t